MHTSTPSGLGAANDSEIKLVSSTKIRANVASLAIFLLKKPKTVILKKRKNRCYGISNIILRFILWKTFFKGTP